MSEALDAITIALIWHEEQGIWHATARQLYYAGLHDRRPVVVEAHDALLVQEPVLRGPLDFAVVHVDRLLHTANQPWVAETPALFEEQHLF